MKTDDILSRLGISELSPMQKKSHEVILSAQSDALILSPTGSGKTLAYLLPLVAQVKDAVNEVQLLVVLPTRELAIQSLEVLRTMKTGIHAYASYGGRSTMQEHQEMRKLQPQIIFGTPGKLSDHLRKQNFSVSLIQTVVIDEYDKCLQMGFQQEMEDIVSFLPSRVRHILLSATRSIEIPRFVNMRNAVTVDFLSQSVNTRLHHHILHADIKDKLPLLVQLLNNLPAQNSIVFLNYRESVERVFAALQEKGFRPSIYHGAFEQKERERALYKFMNGSTNVLVCTDIASRGLDFTNVQNIIHYHLPDIVDTYTHRIGRTARWDRDGHSFYLLSPSEVLPEFMHVTSEDFTLQSCMITPPQPTMQTIYMGRGKRDKISKKDIMGFLCRNADLTVKDVGRIDIMERYSYVAVSRKSLSRILPLSGMKMKGVKVLIEEIN